MLQWLRGGSRKQKRPVWWQWYNILLKEAAEPPWLHALKHPGTAIEGRYFPREEAPEWTFRPDMVGGDPGLRQIADACPALAVISCRYEGDEKLFLSVARLAFQLARREAGVIASGIARRFYRASDYPQGFREFILEDHISVEQVYAGEHSLVGPVWVHTHGLLQFGLPELEVREVPPELVEPASNFLRFMGEWMLGGEKLDVGHTMEAPGHPGVWAIMEPVPPRDNEEHADIGARVLRVSDYDPETNRPTPGLNRYLRTLLEEADAQAETEAVEEPARGRPLWRNVFAAILLLWAAGMLIRIPNRLEAMLALSSSPFTGDFARLATLGLSWPVVARLSAVTAFLRAAGAGLAALGLLTRRIPLMTVGLAGLAIALLSDLPTIPLGIAIAFGRAHIDPAMLGGRPVSADDWSTIQVWTGAISAFTPFAYFGLAMWLLGERRKLRRDKG